MYPAIEITLHLDDVCPVQPWSRIACGYAFLALDGGTNLLPWPRISASTPGRPRALIGMAP